MFHATAMRPVDWPASVEHPPTDDLLADAMEILKLRRVGLLDAQDSLADRFVAACREQCDVHDANRLGSRRRAETLLGELLA